MKTKIYNERIEDASAKKKKRRLQSILGDSK